MEVRVRVVQGTAQDMPAVAPRSVDLVVTSPPYPLVQMWDGVFAAQDPRIGTALAAGKGEQAFQLMHDVLAKVWAGCDRAVKPGGIVCVNVGDATRTMDGDFRLYPNHARIVQAFTDLGYAVLPDILWRKQTNAPNKFMGSGMLPVGAHVTYEHEYILIFRKGARRRFSTPPEKRRRRRSAFFWEERNLWFSDVWSDLKGAAQALAPEAARRRSGAFPFELAYRLIAMFSVRGDHVLDPFAGTGTALAAALALGRSATGIELEPSLVTGAWELLEAAPEYANRHARERLCRHMRFASGRAAAGKPLKYSNIHYGFPVMTAQEQELLISDVRRAERSGPHTLVAQHGDGSQPDMAGAWQNQLW